MSVRSRAEYDALRLGRESGIRIDFVGLYGWGYTLYPVSYSGYAARAACVLD